MSSIELSCACRGKECHRVVEISTLPKAYSGGMYGPKLMVLDIWNGTTREGAIDLTLEDQQLLAEFLLEEA